MNWLDLLASVAKRAFHLRDNQLKGAPGVSDHKSAAAIINALVGAKIDDAIANIHVPSVQNNDFATLLRAHPAELAGQDGIDDHAAAAEHVNTHILAVANDFAAAHAEADPAHPDSMKDKDAH